MQSRHLIFIYALTILTLLASGCNGPTPDIGPTGKPPESKANPPFWERFQAPPAQLYDLEAIAGATFAGINNQDWPQAKTELYNLILTWQEGKPLIGEKKGVDEADKALAKLVAAINNQEAPDAYENLNEFMAGISDIGKS